MDLYIYYKVPEAAADALLPRIRQLQRDLSERHGVLAALKRRPGSSDGRQTWMEVYQDVRPDFAAALARALEATGVADLIDGGRHIETFMDMP